MNKEVLKTKNFNNFALVSVNSDQSLFVKKYYELFKYKLHPTPHPSLNVNFFSKLPFKDIHCQLSGKINIVKKYVVDYH